MFLSLQTSAIISVEGISIVHVSVKPSKTSVSIIIVTALAITVIPVTVVIIVTVIVVISSRVVIIIVILQTAVEELSRSIPSNRRRIVP